MTLLSTSYDAHALKSQIAQYLATSRISVSYRELSSLHNTSVTAYRCAELRANTLAQVPFYVARNGERIDDKENHPLQQLVSKRNGFGEVLRRMEWTYCYWGHSLLAKQRNLSGTVRALQWLNPNLYTLDVDGELEGFHLYYSSNRHEAPPDTHLARMNAVYISGLDFFDDFDGVAPAEVAFSWAAIEPEIAQTLLSVFRNNGIPAAVVQPDKDAKGNYTDAVGELKSLLQRAFKGALNAGRTLVSPVRWEWQPIQSPLKDLNAEAHQTSAEKAICKAYDVPYELISPSASNYAQAVETRRTWGHLWCVFTAERYGEQLTWQLAAEFGDEYSIKPDLDKVPFLKEDAASKTNVVSAQLANGTITLYEARVQEGHEPDEALKDLYMVEGFGPVPKSQLQTLWRTRLPALEQAPETTSQYADDMPRTQPERPERMQLSDGEHTELKNWQYKAQRKGTQAAFECIHLRADVEQRLRERLSGADDTEALKAAFDYARDLCTQKAIQATRLDFEGDFEELLAAARDESNPLPVARFRLILRDLLRKYGTMAYRDGLIDGGVTDAEFDDEDEVTVNTKLAEQSQYVRDIAARLYGDGGISDAQADLKPAMWWGKSLQPLYQAGLLSADRNSNYLWVIDPANENCVTCLALNGQVHRLREYAKRDFLPGSGSLACGGWNCGCKTIKTKERARGRFPVAAKSHEHEHA